MEVKYSTGLGAFGPRGDRFCSVGYAEAKSLRERIEMAAKVEKLSGMELHYPMMFKDTEVKAVKSWLEEFGLECSLVSATVWNESKWKYGSLTNTNPKIRQEAIKTIEQAMDISQELGANRINLWLGQDGFDYPLQANYKDMWQWLMEGLDECAEYDSNVQICLEYKLKEPRTHLIISDVGKALWITQKLNKDNIGVNLDIGHALLSYENPSESAVLLHNEGKLFYIHLNDNYGDWDWDMIPGTVHFWELLELMYWLERLNYNGWLALDIFPARENPIEACRISIENVEKMRELTYLTKDITSVPSYLDRFGRIIEKVGRRIL